MKIFQIKPDNLKWGTSYEYQLSANRAYKLPGVKCDVCCATWGAPGLAYPATDLESFLLNQTLAEYKSGWPVDRYNFDRLKHLISPHVQEDTLLLPSTQFGSLLGKAKGKFGDFAWIGLWTLLVQQQALDSLIKAGVNGLIGIAPKWSSCSLSASKLIELCIEPRLTILPTSVSPDEAQRCSGCGRLLISWSTPLVVFKHSIPADLDIFRGIDVVSSLFVTENFMGAVQRLQLNNITFHEVDVV